MSTISRPVTRGAHHIGLTVPHIASTRDFFVATLGYEQVGEIADYPAVFVSDGRLMITLWQAEDPANATPFDRRRNIGLHHLALAVEPSELDAVHQRLAASGQVQVEFPPEPLNGGPVRHMMCAIPGGVRLELIAVPTR